MVHRVIHDPCLNGLYKPETPKKKQVRLSRVQKLVEVIQLCSNGEPLDQKHLEWRMKHTTQLHLILKFLVLKGLLEKGASKWSRARVYHATEEGKRVARLYSEVEDALSFEKSILSPKVYTFSKNPYIVRDVITRVSSEVG